MEVNPTQNRHSLPLSWAQSEVPRGVTDPDAYRAAQAFETQFSRMLARTMMKDTDMIGGKGMGGETFQGFFVDALGDHLAADGNLGMAEMIYRQLKGNSTGQGYVEAEYQDHRPLSERIRDYLPMIEEAAEANGLDPALVYAVVQTESAFQPGAVSHKGAKGLMQLMDGTAEELGVQQSFDPRENLQGGCAYLRRQLDQFESLEHALAAYNAGPNAVKQYGGIPPFGETVQYVSRVMERYQARSLELSSGSENVKPHGWQTSADSSGELGLPKGDGDEG